jgi:predicted O-linked N-acetylglucosamine transferase (SPINDLY family)
LADLRARAKNHRGASEAAEQALAQTPDDVDLMFWAAQQMIIAGRIKDASSLLRQATLLAPDSLKVKVLQFNTSITDNDVDGAIECIERAVKLGPTDRQVLLARFLLYTRLNRLKEAADAGGDFVKQFPEDADGHYTLGCIFERQGERGGAALAFARYIELKPESAIGYARLGQVLLHVGHLQDAETQLKKAIELDPKLVAAHLHLSFVLEKIPTRMPEAVDSVNAALEIDPRSTTALGWLAAVQTKQGKHTEAAQTYRKILEIDPNFLGALLGYGNLLAGQAQIETGWEHLEKAAEIYADQSHVRATGLFFANAHPDLSRDQIFAMHQKWASLMHKETPEVFTEWKNDRSLDRRLKIGYLSPDLRGHSVSYFLQPLLVAHDRSSVEIYIYDNTPTSDQLSVTLHALVNHWHRIVGGSAERVADMVREHEIDILVDLAGHTSDNRLDVFARHPAPIQVSYLGYPNTTALPEIAYRFTDDIADPVGADTYYTEELIRLPGGFLCFNPPQPYMDVAPLPAGETGNITFASFNAVHKINRKVIALWSRVLHAVPGSSLLMKAGGLADPETRESIMSGFKQHGILEDRIIFVERTLGYREHLEVYNRCDIALDTFPYNGTTTTFESLWMGLPVITLAGDRHAARVSQSILSRLGLSDMVANDADDYIRLAKELANDRKRLAKLRSSIRPTMLESRLRNARALAKEIENAYREMWRKWCNRPGV